MRAAVWTCGVLAAVPAAAQDFATRTGDALLSPAEMQAEIVGQSLTFYDNGVSDYGADGSYAYTYDGGGTAYGDYSLEGGGVVCVAFRNGFDRCDMLVRNGSRLLLITEKGERFPVRP